MRKAWPHVAAGLYAADWDMAEARVASQALSARTCQQPCTVHLRSRRRQLFESNVKVIQRSPKLLSIDPRLQPDRWVNFKTKDVWDCQ